MDPQPYICPSGDVMGIFLRLVTACSQTVGISGTPEAGELGGDAKDSDAPGILEGDGTLESTILTLVRDLPVLGNHLLVF